MSIVDARIRPPFKDFLDLHIFPPAGEDTRGPVPEAGPGLTRFEVDDARSVRDRSMEALLDEMDRSSVGLGIVHGRKAGAKYGSVENESVIQLVDDWANRFRGLVGVEVGDPKAGLNTLETYADAHGICGAAFDPGWQDGPIYPDDESLFPLYGACEDLGLTIVIVSSMLAGPTMDHARPDRIERLAKKFRRARFGIVHGCFPYTNEAIGLLLRCRNVWLVPDFYHFLSGMPGGRMWTDAANGIGQHRIAYASSYPVRAIEQSVNDFLATGIRADVREKVMKENALEMFGLSDEELDLT